MLITTDVNSKWVESALTMDLNIITSKIILPKKDSVMSVLRVFKGFRVP